MTNYELFQQWLGYLATQPWAIGLGSIAIFWIAMQLLSNDWAGGKLFERRFAWVSSAIATVVAFLLFVVPNVSWELALALVGVIVLGVATYFLKKYVH